MKKTVITLMLALMSATASTYAGAAAGKDGVKNIVPENIIVKQTTRFADGRTLVVDIVPYIALAYRDIIKPVYVTAKEELTLDEFDEYGNLNTPTDTQKLVAKAGSIRTFKKDELNDYAAGISPNNVLRVFTPDNFIRHYQTISGGSLDKLGLTTKDVARILSGIPSLGEVYNGNFLIVEGRDGYIYAAPSDDPYLLSRADKNPTKEEAERKLKEAQKNQGRNPQKPPAGSGVGGGINSRLNIVPYGALSWKTIDVPLYKTSDGTTVTTEEYDKEGNKNTLIPDKRKIIEKPGSTHVFSKNEINDYAQGISPNNVLRVFTPDNFIRHYQTISGGSLDKLGLTTKDVVRILSGIPSLGEVHNGNFLIVEGRDGYIYAAPSDDPYLLSRADKNPAREEAERKLREATKGKPGNVQKPPANNGGGGKPAGKPRRRRGINDDDGEIIRM